MNKGVEGKYTVRIELPDALMMPAWQAYARVGRENPDDDSVTRNYKQAMQVIEGGTYTDEHGVSFDLKATPLEKVPPAVVIWVGANVVTYVTEQFSIEKNSSAPPSGRQTPDDTTG